MSCGFFDLVVDCSPIDRGCKMSSDGCPLMKIGPCSGATCNELYCRGYSASSRAHYKTKVPMMIRDRPLSWLVLLAPTWFRLKPQGSCNRPAALVTTFFAFKHRATHWSSGPGLISPRAMRVSDVTQRSWGFPSGPDLIKRLGLAVIPLKAAKFSCGVLTWFSAKAHRKFDPPTRIWISLTWQQRQTLKMDYARLTQ